MHFLERNQISCYPLVFGWLHIYQIVDLTSINKENCRKQPGDFRCVSECPTNSPNRSEQLDKAQCLGDDDDPEGEEFAGIHLQCSHEVKND